MCPELRGQPTAYTRLKADEDTMDAFVHLRKKKGAGGCGEANVGLPVLATPLWDISMPTMPG